MLEGFTEKLVCRVDPWFSNPLTVHQNHQKNQAKSKPMKLDLSVPSHRCDFESLPGDPMRSWAEERSPGDEQALDGSGELRDG